MKMLHVADIHIDHEWFDWIANSCKNHDLLVIAGDLLNAFSSLDLHQQAEAVRNWLLALEAPTILCTGNHDYWVVPQGAIDSSAEGRWLSSLSGQRNVVAADGDQARLHGLDFVVNGWLHKPDHGGDILVTHAPPAGCRCACSDGNDNGDPELWGAMQRKPRLILAGHIHRPNAFSHLISDSRTMVLVPGCDEQSSVPSHWVIETERGVAVHSTGIVVNLPQSS